jgi:exosortase/archaeosortase family protein
MAAEREGTAMSVEGRLVIVDAPCSGVQMAWMAYFCACAVGWWSALPDRAFARRLAGVGAIVLAGNVVRNSILVGLEARGAGASPAWHEALGLALLALVCAAVAALVHGGRDARR